MADSIIVILKFGELAIDAAVSIYGWMTDSEQDDTKNQNAAESETNR